jgi:hypothetical protein
LWRAKRAYCELHFIKKTALAILSLSSKSIPVELILEFSEIMFFYFTFMCFILSPPPSEKKRKQKAKLQIFIKKNHYFGHAL